MRTDSGVLEVDTANVGHNGDILNEQAGTNVYDATARCRRQGLTVAKNYPLKHGQCDK